MSSEPKRVIAEELTWGVCWARLYGEIAGSYRNTKGKPTRMVSSICSIVPVGMRTAYGMRCVDGFTRRYTTKMAF